MTIRPYRTLANALLVRSSLALARHESRWCSILWIEEHNVNWFASRGIYGQEDSKSTYIRLFVEQDGPIVGGAM